LVYAVRVLPSLASVNQQKIPPPLQQAVTTITAVTLLLSRTT
jgi:hypothetical protein